MDEMTGVWIPFCILLFRKECGLPYKSLYGTLLVGSCPCHGSTKVQGHTGGFYHIVCHHGVSLTLVLCNFILSLSVHVWIAACLVFVSLFYYFFKFILLFFNILFWLVQICRLQQPQSCLELMQDAFLPSTFLQVFLCDTPCGFVN